MITTITNQPTIPVCLVAMILTQLAEAWVYPANFTLVVLKGAQEVVGLQVIAIVLAQLPTLMAIYNFLAICFVVGALTLLVKVRVGLLPSLYTTLLRARFTGLFIPTHKRCVALTAKVSNGLLSLVHSKSDAYLAREVA